MKALVILLAISAPVSAQTTAWTSTSGQKNYSNCCANGECWMERGDVCHSNSTEREHVLIGADGRMTTITNTPMPKCPEGYQLVLRGAGQPACARDVINPQ